MSINYFQLLGQPLENASLQALIKQYQLQDELADIDWTLKDHEGNIICDNNHQAIFSSFNNIDNLEILRIVLSRKPKITDPLTIDDIVFFKDFDGEYPCGLTTETSYESVNLGIKISFEKNPYGGFGKDFLVEGCVASLYFDEEKQFQSVTISALDANTALLIQFKNELNQQKFNINTNFSVQNLDLPSPVIAWRKRQADGDSLFTEANLSASQQLLYDFLTETTIAATKKSPTQLLAAVKNVTKSFNKLNKQYQYFIETSEREELAHYIQEVAKTAGLQLPDGLDITLEWRDW